MNNQFCGCCSFLSPTEREQDLSRLKKPHICQKYNKHLRNGNYHPNIPKLEICKQENIILEGRNYNE
jgi:hypothetical protein